MENKKKKQKRRNIVEFKGEKKEILRKQCVRPAGCPSMRKTTQKQPLGLEARNSQKITLKCGSKQMGVVRKKRAAKLQF